MESMTSGGRNYKKLQLMLRIETLVYKSIHQNLLFKNFHSIPAHLREE